MFVKRQARLLTQFLGVVACSLIFSPPASAQQVVGGINIFLPSSVFNTRIDSLPVDKNSSKYINALGAQTKLHPDFDTDPADGIPVNVVTGIPTSNNPVFKYSDESDSFAAYPDCSVLSTLIEKNDWSPANDGDRHVLFVDTTNGLLYEFFNTTIQSGTVHADAGAIFNLNSNALRPNGWTSADAAGLPIFPLLVNYQEAAAGPVKHAFRLTGGGVNGKIWPARHETHHTSPWPPYGQRFRLKKSYNLSQAPSTAIKNVCIAMQQYGLIFADQGSNWYVTGIPNSNWTDNDLDFFKSIPGSAFEAVDETSLMYSPDSQIVRTATRKPPVVSGSTPKPWPKVK